MISKSRAIELIADYQIYCNNGNCPLCQNAPLKPYRRYDSNGKVLEGCISIHHGNVDNWDNRPEAKPWKASQRAGMLLNWTQADLEALDDMGPALFSVKQDYRLTLC